MAKNAITTLVKLIVIGGSSGSLTALLNIFEVLKVTFIIPVIIVLHRSIDVNESLVKLLSIKTKRKVVEAEEKEIIAENYIYLAPPDYHLLIEKDGSLSLDASEKVKYSRPSIDVTFQSAAAIFKESLVGILLSGSNTDGTLGIATINKLGGKTIIQNPDEALFKYMPVQAIASTKSAQILTAKQIGNYLNNLNK